MTPRETIARRLERAVLFEDFLDDHDWSPQSVEAASRCFSACVAGFIAVVCSPANLIVSAAALAIGAYHVLRAYRAMLEARP